MYQQRKAADSSEDCPHPRDDFDDNQTNGAKIRVHIQVLTIQLNGMRARCRALQRSARSLGFSQHANLRPTAAPSRKQDPPLDRFQQIALPGLQSALISLQELAYGLWIRLRSLHASRGMCLSGQRKRPFSNTQSAFLHALELPDRVVESPRSKYPPPLQR